MNRVAVWVIGVHSVQRALLLALLEPTDKLRAMEESGDFTGRLALLEELKGLAAGAVWDYFCVQRGVPVGYDFMSSIRAYEHRVFRERT